MSPAVGGTRLAERADAPSVRRVKPGVGTCAVLGVVDVHVLELGGMAVRVGERDLVVAVGGDLQVRALPFEVDDVAAGVQASWPSGCTAKVGFQFPPRQNR